MAGRAGAATADARARAAVRLAGTGSNRRRAVLVTSDGHGPLAEALRRGPLGRGLVVVGAGDGTGAGTAREGQAEGDEPSDEKGRPRVARRADGRAPAGTARELVALLACCALALLATVPLRSMIHEGVWETPVAALLGVGAGAGALACALASSRAARAAVALEPLALSAADQVIMGAAAPLDWVAAAVALGLLLIWLGVCERARPARAAVVAALACALGWAGSALAPAEGSAVWSAGGTRVETLVDLSRDLRRRSSAEVLTYQTTASGPVYLRIGVLDDFDGSTWSFSGDVLEGDSPLARAGLDEPDRDWASLLDSLISTTVWPEEGTPADEVPLPPGTATLEATGEGAWTATGRYVTPIQAASQTNALLNLASALSADGGSTRAPDDGTLSVPDDVPASVSEVVTRARAAGVTGRDTAYDQEQAVNWIVTYFTDGSFTYSLDAPDGTADESGTCTVTMRQLHAWAEVWLDGIGWVGVDVTPAATDEGADADATQPQESETTTPEEEATPEEPADEPAETDQGETDGAAAATTAPLRRPARTPAQRHHGWSSPRSPLRRSRWPRGFSPDTGDRPRAGRGSGAASAAPHGARTCAGVPSSPRARWPSSSAPVWATSGSPTRSAPSPATPASSATAAKANVATERPPPRLAASSSPHQRCGEAV